MHTPSIMPFGYYLRGESESGYCLGWKPVVLTIHFSGPASQTHEWILERERERKKKAVKKRTLLFTSLRHWRKFKDTMLWSSHRKLYHKFHTRGACHFSLRSHSGPGRGSDDDSRAVWACLQLSPPIARPIRRLQTTYSPRFCSRSETSLASPYIPLFSASTSPFPLPPIFNNTTNPPLTHTRKEYKTRRKGHEASCSHVLCHFSFFFFLGFGLLSFLVNVPK